MIRMNEKRFQWNERIEGRIVEEFVVDNLTKKELDEEDMCELLNELSAENEQLKQRNEFLKKRCNEYWKEAGLNNDYED